MARAKPGAASRAADRYVPQELEPRWQQRWAAEGIYQAEMDPSRRKFYNLMMYPYPSGDLHMGHARSFGLADTYARFKRMQGYNVLNPMGWDSFGLPAENAAIQRGIHPRTFTERAIAKMKQQFMRMGMSYDWRREVSSMDPGYYRWNQWIFLQMFERELAYRAMAPVNWCPSCQTILANEQVLDGRCWRCETEVTKRDLEQWFLRITAYAQELLEDLEKLEHWPERVRSMQRHWIGRSEGVQFDLGVAGHADHKIPVFTTRVDTVYGITFAVLAPEHPLVAVLTTPERRAEVEAYVQQARRASEIERLSTEREWEGVPIGALAVNPMNGQQVPLYVADYVLMSYGTGAIMGVPAHDRRDLEFARRYGLEIPVVVAPPGWEGEPLQEAYLEPGTMVNSAQFDGLPSEEAKERIADHMEEGGIGHRHVSYRLRDWLISRQRYWGTPIPMIHCQVDGWVPVPEQELPVELPDTRDFAPRGKSPLAAVESFVRAPCPVCGRQARRETDTMDTFVDSSWYFFRYTDPHNSEQPFDPQRAAYWMPVDQYTGGIEHAILHLLYSRFFTKVLRDMGLTDLDEPFLRLYTHGMLTYEGGALSKSKGARLAIDAVANRYGADTGRLYVLFLAPPDQDADWTDAGVEGPHRFLHKVWRLALAGETVPAGEEHAERQIRRRTHQTIARVTEDIQGFHHNTAISALMELSNALADHLEGHGPTPAYQEGIQALIQLLAPFAPHITEELWQRRGGQDSVHLSSWPQWDLEVAREEVITLVLQVDGKVRDKVEVPADIAEEQARQLALASERVRPYLEDGGPRRVIYVPGKLVNVVTR